MNDQQLVCAGIRRHARRRSTCSNVPQLTPIPSVPPLCVAPASRLLLLRRQRRARPRQLAAALGRGQLRCVRAKCSHARCFSLRVRCQKNGRRISGDRQPSWAHNCGCRAPLRPRWAPIRAQSGGGTTLARAIASQRAQHRQYLPAPRALRPLASRRAASGSAQPRRLRGGVACVQRALALAGARAAKHAPRRSVVR